MADYPGLANDLSLMGFDFWGENPAISQNAKVLSPRLIDNRHWPREIWVGLTAVSSKAGAKSSPDFEPNLSNQFFYCDVDGDGHFNPGPTPPTDELLAGGSCKLSGRSTAFTLTAPPDTFTYRQSTRTIKFDNLADEVQP